MGKFLTFITSYSSDVARRFMFLSLDIVYEKNIGQ